MMRRAEFAELQAFAAVAQDRSFRKAAFRLGVTPSALSHVVRALEERLGAKLLHRTTRSVAPTEAGLVLLGRLVPAMEEIAHAVSEVSVFSNHPRGKLRLNLPRLAAEVVLLPKLAQFTQLYPDIVLDLVIEDRMTDIIAKGFEAGIRPGVLVQGDMIAVRLTPDVRMAVVASPAYLATRDRPVTPHDLQAHRCINYRWGHDGASYRWSFQNGDEELEVRLDAAIMVNDTNLITEFALAGQGFAYILENAVATYVATGQLVRVLDDWCQPISGFYLYYSGHRHMSATLQAMIDFFRCKAE